MGHIVEIRPSIPNAVRIGGVDKPGLRRALRVQGVQLNDAAEALFNHPRFTTLSQIHMLEISATSAAELGFGEGATYPQISERARELGLSECPLELGPHFRMQFPEQPEALAGTLLSTGRAPQGSITIASVPLDEDDLSPKGFYLRRLAGVPWLRGYWSSFDHVWAAGDLLVFSRGLTVL